MKNKVIIIVVILLVALIGVGVYFGVKANNKNKYQTADKYTVKGEEIPSINSVLGERKVKNYSYTKEDTEVLELTFETQNAQEDAEKYINYLFENENFLRERLNEENRLRVAKSADNTTGVVTVETEKNDKGLKVTIIVGPGTIKVDPVE